MGVPEVTVEALGTVVVAVMACETVTVSVTGVAGPAGGTPDKPVGLVYLHAAGPDGELAADFNLPADRETIRRRATVGALHLVRTLVTELAQTRHG